MNLVIVETPAQAKVLTGVLGEGWQVEPCYGVLRVFPTGRLGVDVDGDFQPTFEIAPGKANLVRRLMKAVRESEAVYAATPPNRAGEAMAWHVLALSPDAKNKPVHRVMLNALTSEAIQAAFQAPRPLNSDWIEADMTEQSAEHLVKWSVGSALTKRLEVKQALSRRALIALRSLAERERSLSEAAPETGWLVNAQLRIGREPVEASLYDPHGMPVRITSHDKAEQLVNLLTNARYWVEKVGVRTQERASPEPYHVQMLLLDAETKLGLAPQRVLSLLETLYEVGWVTHPDADPMVETADMARRHIGTVYGTEYLVSETRTLRGIVPTHVHRLPDEEAGDGMALYDLIWWRSIAAQMPPAQMRQSGAKIGIGTTREKPPPLQLRAYGNALSFDGWLRALPDALPEFGDPLPELQMGDPVTCLSVSLEASDISLPMRHTPAGWIALHGTAQPETWVKALDELVQSENVRLENGFLLPSSAGLVLAEFVEKHFPSLVSDTTVGAFEPAIARVAAGSTKRSDVLRNLWEPLHEALHTVENVAAPPRRAAEHKPVTLRPAEEV